MNKDLYSTYIQPHNLQELSEVLSQLPEQTVIMAGGTDLLVAIRAKKIQFHHMLSLSHVQELGKIEKIGEWIRIGATVTHDQIARDGRIKEYFQALSMACSHVGSQQVRNRGTIGGSLGNASVAGDILPNLYLLGAEIETLQGNQSRRRSLEEFILPNGKPNLEMNEIISYIWVPVCEGRESCFVKLGSRKEVTIAQISLCASWRRGENGIVDLKAYAGAIDRKPCALPEIAMLEGKTLDSDKVNEFAALLREKIAVIRKNRKRESKLKITEAEKSYKERAVKGVVWDMVNCIPWH